MLEKRGKKKYLSTAASTLHVEFILLSICGLTEFLIKTKYFNTVELNDVDNTNV